MARAVTIAAAFALAAAASPALAQGASRDGGAPLISLVVENDLFAGRDGDYTNGLRAEYVATEGALSPPLEWLVEIQPLFDPSTRELRQGVAISHQIYTAADITDPNPPPGGHPYAGYLGVSTFGAARTEREERTLALEIGLVGPSAGGEWVQSEWHALLDAKEPRGWDVQLKDEVVFELSADRVRRWRGPEAGGLDTDLIGHAGFSLGTLRTDLSLGATVRIGTGLEAGFLPPRIRPALGPTSVFSPPQALAGYVFAGVGVYAIGRDIFLDGNTFKTSRSVDRHPVVADAQAGFAAFVGGHRVSFTFVMRTEQFSGQTRNNAFGAISVSRTF